MGFFKEYLGFVSLGILENKSLTQKFEKDGMSIDDEWHLFVLHSFFFSRVQEELHEFKCVWNDHQVSTEGNETPLQILVLRADSFPDPVDVNDNYGVEAKLNP